jgi:predicted ATPase
MLDNVFKNSRKFFGVPLAILLVAVIALATGGTVLGAYLTQTVTVITTVTEPLSYEYDWHWSDVAGEPVWAPNLRACENQTAQLFIYNAANVDVPISVEAYTYDQVSGVSCSITMLDGDALPTTVVPAYETVVVYVTVEAACWLEIPKGTPLETAWTVDFRRG